MFQPKMSNFKVWLHNNKLVLITIYSIYQIAIIAIGSLTILTLTISLDS